MVAKAKEAKEPVARKRKASKYQSFKLQKKIPHPAGPVPSVWVLLKKTRSLILENWKPLSVLVLLFVFLNLAFVRGFTSPINVDDVKLQVQELFGADIGKWTVTTTIFGLLIGDTTNQSNGNAGYLQITLLLIFALALIWLFRQSSTGNARSAKSALYKGMYPLVQFLLVIGILIAECIPAILGGGIYSATVGSGIAASGYEQAIWTLLSGLLILLTLHLLLSSIFALYIVTLPDMTPIRAVQSARHLVFSRKLNIIVKLLVVVILFSLLLVLVVIPTIYFIPFIAPWVFLGAAVMCGFLLHAYLFTLYRELL